jgi:hypothetical protein
MVEAATLTVGIERLMEILLVRANKSRISSGYGVTVMLFTIKSS